LYAAEDTAAAPEVGPLPAFARIGPATIERDVDAALAEARARINALLQQPDEPGWDNFVVPLEDTLDALARTWAPIRHLHSVMSSDELRAAYNACLPKLTRFHTELGQNRAVYGAYRTIRQGDEYDRLNREQRKAIDDALRDFELAGVALAGPERTRFAEIEDELSELQSRFEENVLDATHAWQKPIARSEDLSGLGPDALGMAREAARSRGLDGWVLTLEFPLFHAVMTSADDRELRCEVYAAWTTRASDQGPHAGQYDNGPLMERIVALRQEKAALLGYASFAELALEDRMVERPADVLSFLNDLAGRALPAARAEFDELAAFAADRHGIHALQPWDVGYVSESLRRERFAISDEMLKPWFPAPRVIDGLFAIAGRLFGLQFEPVEGVEVWHPDVAYYRVRDTTGAELGGFYFDLYARSNKRGGAWMDECIGRSAAGGRVQLPVAFLTCNLTPPVDDRPARFTHDEVLTLFHEFGHGLHHLLTRVDIPSLAGISGVEWDAVELPSQLLENWCWYREGLDWIAAHDHTGEPLGGETVARLQASRTFHEALGILRQVEFSLFDFCLHMELRDPAESDIRQLLEAIRSQVAVIRPPAYNRFAHAFSHIFAGGYAAGYYSYKWAEVLAADAFGAFEENGLLDAATGRAFRECVLERGGSRPMRENFRDFRGRDPEAQALLRQAGLA